MFNINIVMIIFRLGSVAEPDFLSGRGEGGRLGTSEGKVITLGGGT